MRGRTAEAEFDVVVLGGGHNGLVAAAYLGKAGLRTALVEARETLGGPCGAYEFLPGRRLSFTNSPGSLDPAVVAELDLAGFGLRFVPADPTVVQRYDDGYFLGWRDQARVERQLDAFAPGEGARYRRLVDDLERLGRTLGVSLAEPSPSLAELARRLRTPEDERLFTSVFLRGLTELLDDYLVADETKALLTMLALNAHLVPPSAPGTAVGLMMRPFALASRARLSADDPGRVALRGSTGLPVGSMSAIVDALERCCRSHGVHIRTGSPVTDVVHAAGRVRGVAVAGGDVLSADRVVAAVSPVHLFRDLLDDEALGPEVRRAVASRRIRGSAFKVLLEVDGLPPYADLPEGVSQTQAATCQFRLGGSPAGIERSIHDALAGIPSQKPLMWGLIPTITSPHLTPGDTHLISVNAWHAPYDLREGDWESETDKFGRRCVDELSRLMPGLADRIVDHRFMGPVEIERELGLVESNITHGDMLPGDLFATRPHPEIAGYRTPLRGFYLSGSGTWPGGYVTGIPGRNASRAVLSDALNERKH
ncbi:phytoene desaturase family protein [Sinosporangium siamense]|uniref:Pyridine nucleotide-disulfide oxidoreductase domain-containing protein 2 n=1 Tax=Sinosporangium siamense TaxID=1367973 RepID=A0A919REB8_9ACTN|nr:NAD(P)/FAD-dependent oxidoreductase [Sinosporangium siamense]GII92122.1 oxidoreductase [Sinosporangium siamense]